MKKIKIKNTEVQELLLSENTTYPKYTTQIMNLANQNAQGTRPKVVGQLSDLIQEFDGNNLQEWESWYTEKQPDAIQSAKKKIIRMVDLLKDAIDQIDEELIEKWVKELIIVKTYAGLRFQEAILKKVASLQKKSYRLALPEEESQGIDGYIGDTPVSIKPITYKTKNSLQESIDVPIIFYEKKKDGINIEIPEIK